MANFGKFNLLSILGVVLSLGGTLVTGWVNKKVMDDTIAKEVEKALKNH